MAIPVKIAGDGAHGPEIKITLAGKLVNGNPPYFRAT